MKDIKGVINQLLSINTGILAWAGSFLSIITLRVFIEQFVSKKIPIDIYDIVIEFVHNLFFFLISFLLIWILLSFILKVNPKELATFLVWASLLIIFPPLIDMVKTGGEVYWSFYSISDLSNLIGQYFTFFGRLPSGIVYFGTKIIFVLAILFGSALVYFKTKKFGKTAISAVGIYSILFFMGCFPSIFVLISSFLSGGDITGVKSFEIAQFFGTPAHLWGLQFYDLKYTFAYKLDLIYYPLLVFILTALLYLINKEKFKAVLANFRYPQVVYHGGLLFVGMGLGFLNFPENFTINLFSILAVGILLISIFLAWKASVVVNDLYDQPIDEITNSWRPLPKKIFDRKEYQEFGIICFLLSLLGGLIIGFKFLILFLIYQIIAWFYSAGPFRLKKFPLIATLVSSLASIMIVFMGYILVSPDQTIHTLSWRIVLMLVITYTISIPIKDFKDIAGDKKYGVWTIPVIFGEERGRLIVAINLFISYVISVFFLNEFKLFFWAILFGVVSFWLVNTKKIKPEKLPGFILGLVFIYGIILMKVVFL